MQSPRQNHALVVPTVGPALALASGGIDNNSTVLGSAEVYSAGAWTLTHPMVYFSGVVAGPPVLSGDNTLVLSCGAVAHLPTDSY